jgi:glycosyltransferase involved in cell wall biosynthesis
MSRRRQKARAAQKAKTLGATDANRFRERYDRACEMAEGGQTAEAKTFFLELAATATDLARQALVRNDLAALAALTGTFDEARRGFQVALQLDPACEAAQRNLDFLDHDGAGSSPSSGDAVSSAPHDGRVKVAILSFLFNWPSTGGGNVHSAELGPALARAGYRVKHFYARFVPWRIGEVSNPLFPWEAIDFDESAWTLAAIQKRFRQAVDEFAPDFVILTDSWNIKPALAEAVRGYRYILRLQAMECLCPLNNLRLLYEGDGRFRQCPLHQLADPDRCARCVAERGGSSGSLHKAERDLSGWGSPDYVQCLRQSVRDAFAVLVVNPLHEAMLGPYNGNVRVVTSGFDPARFPIRAELRERHGAAKTVLFFAGLVEEMIKGYRVLHDACTRLWQKRQDFELIATGDPPGAVNAFTRFVGWQSQADLPRYMHNADIVVIPTIAQEALGRTAVEAMAASRPVVASRIGGLPFTVLDGATGLLFEPGNAGDLAQKLEALLDDPALRVRFGQAGRRCFEEHYTWDVIVERHYKPLLGEPTMALPAR